jgi:hypothetical protein
VSLLETIHTMSSSELTARLDETFGKDTAVTQLTAADLKAMHKHRGASGKWVFHATVH